MFKSFADDALKCNVSLSLKFECVCVTMHSLMISTCSSSHDFLKMQLMYYYACTTDTAPSF